MAPNGMMGNSVALEFDGGSTYVNCVSSPSLDITEEITVVAWVKFEGVDYKNSSGGLFSIAAKGSILMLLRHMQDGGSLMTIETMVKVLTILASVIKMVDGQAVGIISLDVTFNLPKESGIT